MTIVPPYAPITLDVQIASKTIIRYLISGISELQYSCVLTIVLTVTTNIPDY